MDKIRFDHKQLGVDVDILEMKETFGIGPLRMGLVALLLSGLILLALGLTKNCLISWTILLFGIIAALGLLVLKNELGAALSFFCACTVVFFIGFGLYMGDLC